MGHGATDLCLGDGWGGTVRCLGVGCVWGHRPVFGVQAGVWGHRSVFRGCGVTDLCFGVRWGCGATDQFGSRAGGVWGH